MGAGARLMPKLLAQLVALIVVFAAVCLALSLWLAAFDPGLLAARMKSPVQKGQKPWDRGFLMLLMVVYLSWLAVMALDSRRVSWSHAPFCSLALGAAMIVASY